MFHEFPAVGGSWSTYCAWGGKNLISVLAAGLWALHRPVAIRASAVCGRERGRAEKVELSFDHPLPGN